MKIKQIILHLFTPQENNDYKAKTLHTNFLSFYLIAALLLVCAVKNVDTRFSDVLGYATDISVQKLMELTNMERQNNSLPPLQYNDTLSSAAQKKAEDMFVKNYWSHYGPDGTSPWSFILQSGYKYQYAGENLAKNFLFSQGVVNAWMNSQSHKENLLRKEYTEVGYAIVNGVLNGEETTLVVQMFGTPIQETVANPAEATTNDASLAQSKPEPMSKETPAVLGKDITKPKINLLFFSIDLTYVFIFFFGLVLIADFYVASKLHVVRIGGKHIAHLIFLGFITIGIIFFVSGGAI